MKKKISLPLLLVSMFAITGCANQTKATTNKTPSIVGVKDFKCIVNTTIDFLDGVAALDKEDGDITPQMGISISNDVSVNENGYATFTKPGTYTVTYKVSDSQGKSSQKVCYVDVVTRDEYRTFALAEDFTYNVNGSAKVEKCGMVNGKFKLIAKGGNAAEDIKLNRTFKVETGKEYTYKYGVTSTKAGKILIEIDSTLVGEFMVKEGKNEIIFKHTLKKGEEVETKEIEASLCVGDLADEFDWTIESVDIEYPQEEGKVVNLTENFSFAGRVHSRFDNDGGKLNISGNAFSHDEGKQAVLEIDDVCEDIWRGGMFIQTGVVTKPNVTYTISFDVEAREESDFEVVIKKDQWGENNHETLYTPKGHVELDITPDNGKAGDLWFYVQSGTAVNRIALGNLKVEEHLGKVGKDSFRIEDFYENHEGVADSYLETDCGSFVYHVNKFEETDWKQKVTSPTFYVNGSGGNYVVSFKAKATKPVEFVCAAPVLGGWDPTLFWSRITLSEEEQVYTLFCNTSASDRDYTIVWQFGSGNNQRFENVDIEISDVSINLRNRELDG